VELKIKTFQTNLLHMQVAIGFQLDSEKIVQMTGRERIRFIPLIVSCVASIEINCNLHRCRWIRSVWSVFEYVIHIGISLLLVRLTSFCRAAMAMHCLHSDFCSRICSNLQSILIFSMKHIYAYHILGSCLWLCHATDGFSWHWSSQPFRLASNHLRQNFGPYKTILGFAEQSIKMNGR
jgi:hypothetical protein